MVARMRKALRMQLLPAGLGFAALAALVGAQFWLAATQLEESHAIRQALALDRRMASTFSLLQDAEAGQQGYLLTRDESYLQPYDAAVAALPGELSAIRQSIAGNSTRTEQLDQLASATQETIAALDEVIRLFRAGDGEAALSLMRSGRSKAAMARVRTLVRDIQRDESAQMQQRLDVSARAENGLLLASIVILLGVLAVAAHGLVGTRRYLRDISAAHENLAAQNTALEHEIATRQAAEAQMRQMQKMEAIGQLTGGIAHDFNNMLAVVISAMNLARRKLSRGDSDVLRFVEAATDAANRAAELTQRLLAFARQQPLTPQVIDANALVTGMSKLLKRALGKAVIVDTVLVDGVWPIWADPSQLENAILNLAVNGRDAMPDGGTLTIETANLQLGQREPAEGADLPAGDYVMVAISDTGTGMPPEVAAQAFDPFFTTKGVSKGTGLGLSQVYGFVRQSGGHVELNSVEGRGTRVTIYLRRHSGTGEAVAAGDQTADPQSPSAALVLVTDDDRPVRAGSSAALHELGYRVLEAGDGKEALRILDERPDVDLLFTDIMMPGMDGWQLAEEARKRHPRLKVLFTTGFARDAAMHGGKRADVLTKPFTVDQLAARLQAVLGGDRESQGTG